MGGRWKGLEIPLFIQDTGGQQSKSAVCFNFLWKWTFGISSWIVTAIQKVAIVAAVLYKDSSAIVLYLNR